MSALTALVGGLTPAAQTVRLDAAAPRKQASPVTQTGTLTFAKSSTDGVDSTVSLGSIGLDAATTKLTANVALKAGTKYTFSFWFAKNAPTVTLIDSQGKSTKVNMASGFTAAKSGNYLPAATDARQFTIMSYKDNNASRGVNATTPMLYDVAALQYLYGANTSASTASSGKFDFTDGNTYLQTLWSATGTDTIDLSGLKNSSKVDLNSGAYSSINITGAATSSSYSGNNNVAIAYAAKINNVTLSSTNGVAESVTLNNAFVSGSYDTVGSFDASVDRIALKKSLFGSLSTGSIEVGSAATSKNTRIVVNNATGDIYYDADGNGKGAAKKIAHYSVIAGGAALGAGNFSFVA